MLTALPDRMSKRSVLLFLAAVILLVAASSSISERTRAQGMFFGATRFPAIDVDGNDNLYLMMSVATAPASEHRPHSQIFFTISRDNGSSWDNLPLTRNLSNSPGEAFGPSLAVFKKGPTRVYVSYQDNSDGPTQAHLIRSKKKTKFRKPLNITPHNGGAISPRVALDSSEAVNIAWGDLKELPSKVVFVRSTDQGATFSAPVDVSRSSGAASEPEIAVDPSDAINVVWQDNASGASEIMFSRSTDQGLTFSDPLKISGGTGLATEAAITSDEAGRLGVVWVGESTGHAEAYYARSANGGRSFTEPINVSRYGDGDIHKPSVVASGDTVYVAFQNGGLFGEETIPNMQVYLAKSKDAGVSFGDWEQVSRANNSRGRAHSPAMVLDSQGTLHIVWIDASVVGNDEGLLFYSKTPNGRGFSPQFVIVAVL